MRSGAVPLFVENELPQASKVKAMFGLYLTSSAWGPSYGDPSKYNDISKWKDTIKNNENNAEGTRFSYQRSSRKNSFDMTLVGNDHDYDWKETMYRHNWPHYLVENFELMFFKILNKYRIYFCSKIKNISIIAFLKVIKIFKLLRALKILRIFND